mmetsp:Transcript_52862/g.92842  ORF Transcript_52862/g.92842 Transcript_52862/m.92842 type:complete len:237 (-) Transcript_52862:1383-2093(-)
MFSCLTAGASFSFPDAEIPGATLTALHAGRRFVPTLGAPRGERTGDQSGDARNGVHFPAVPVGGAVGESQRTFPSLMLMTFPPPAPVERFSVAQPAAASAAASAEAASNSARSASLRRRSTSSLARYPRALVCIIRTARRSLWSCRLAHQVRAAASTWMAAARRRATLRAHSSHWRAAVRRNTFVCPMHVSSGEIPPARVTSRIFMHISRTSIALQSLGRRSAYLAANALSGRRCA